MTERERLMELINDIEYCPEKTCINFGGKCKGCKFSNGFICNMTERKADYLLAHGVIVSPCMVGDTVYAIGYAENIREYTVANIQVLFCKNVIRKRIVCTNAFEIEPLDIGKTVFLTREEAEKALKESD